MDDGYFKTLQNSDKCGIHVCLCDICETSTSAEII